MPKHNAYRSGKVHVCDKLCETCIFKPNSVIPDERREQMIEESNRNDSAIICHSTLNTKPKRNAVCRGYYEHHGSESASIRAAIALEMILFVDPYQERD